MDENRLYEGPDETFSLCAKMQERFPDLLEGYLDAMTAEAVRAHIAVCFFCARMFGEMEHTIKLIETLPFVDPGRDFGPSIIAAIQEQIGGAERRPWWRWRPPPRQE